MKALSLFSNVGFGEVYLNQLGIDIVVANEWETRRCNLYKEFHPNTNVICGDITKDDVKAQIYDACPDAIFEEGIDLIIATPPCQGMSVANAKRHPKDNRNKLIVHVMEVFNSLLPSYMLIENVPAMAETYINVDGEVINMIDYIKSELPDDYDIKYKVLNAQDYNTPQSRKRFIGLISKGGKWEHPKVKNKLITVKDAIGHLPSLESAESSKFPWHYAKKHNDLHIKWMKHTPTGKSAFQNLVWKPMKDGRLINGFATTYKRMDWDKPAPTVTMCNGAISSQNNVHPGNLKKDGTYSDARVLSVMELGILCGLPEDFFDKLKGKYQEGLIRKVLGECFPPTMCLEIMKGLFNENS